MGTKLRVAILGTGNIGTDLLIKIHRSPYLECVLFIGRNLSSPGMAKAISMGVPVSDESISAIEKNPGCCEVVFDCTSANDALYHSGILKKLVKFVVDMTPAKVGSFCIPAVNLQEAIKSQNVNMVTCGGQASIPIAYAIGQTHKEVEYIEVVSSIASRSAGPATRLNLDEYVDTTEEALCMFSGCLKSKAILNLNPAQPCIDMQTTIFAKIAEPHLEALNTAITDIIFKVKAYTPGYQLLVPPIYENGRIVVMIKAQGLGDYLPKYAGNLDIINCAGVAVAEEFAKIRNYDNEVN